ncbi:MAG: DNA-binding protein [Desulfurococcales archaeon]|nr:DNA-binding protein [Desulfurococcales archaeon]
MRGSTPGCSPTGSVIILDTGAFLSGFPRLVTGIMYTVPEVVEEVRDRESRRLLEEVLALGRLIILDPGDKYQVAAERIAKRGRLTSRLSSTDIKVLALSIRFKEAGCRVLVATDDYALRRVLRSIGIGIVPLRYKGVSRGGEQYTSDER